METSKIRRRSVLAAAAGAAALAGCASQPAKPPQPVSVISFGRGVNLRDP
ncbi:twin-arginine translocation signal domain-containing protein [Ramlibacter sp. G-1-2-2]|uniref:Twin-arginine translocation signal domain-containing protein n=1 Tax=Ramlibacter agri TaxID=2728837 RepID=A0A848H0D6_9BURK|nr:twin-arginine translocation signal domain-containing protein [Ramlibacter agri]NML43091.1 twin-arginine translocation signal domain-containing protein [Ramlibacter agri]